MKTLDNLSIKRLGFVLLAAFVIGGIPQAQAVLNVPMVEGASWSVLLDRMQFAVVQGIDGTVSALLAAMVGFFTRADKSLPLLSIASTEGTDA